MGKTLRYGERETRLLTNFGGNVAFEPRHLYEPASEDDVRGILEKHQGAAIRVVGSMHSWSPILETPDVVIDLRRMQRVQISRSSGGVEVCVEAGCTVKRLLRILDEDAGVTLPAIGAVTEQTIGGAVATGTHGSGQHSMSHTVAAIRVIGYDGTRVVGREFAEEDDSTDGIRAARCALGCLGVVVSVRIRCVRQYFVAETVRGYRSLAEVLAQRDAHPLQYFLLMPFLWRFVSFRRHAVAGRPGHRQRLYAWFQRLKYRAFVDYGFHLLFTRAAALFRRPATIRRVYRIAGPLLLERSRAVIDRSDRALTLNHHWFPHVELELAVPECRIAEATELVRVVTEVFGGADASDAGGEEGERARRALERIGMWEQLVSARGSYAHNYPLSYRLVLPDDTWLSQSSGEEAFYTISWFCYEKDTTAFLGYASFLARALFELYDARPHFGKLFPLPADEVAELYPRLVAFFRLSRGVDPAGVFLNEFTRSLLER